MGETDCSLVGYGTLTEKDWNVLYDLASNQGLTETVFSAIEKLPKSQLPPMDLLMDWLGQVEYIKSSNEGYREKAHDLLEVYRSKGIIFVVLKGESCARYYPDPEKRALGDLDVFLLEEPMEVSNFRFQVTKEFQDAIWVVMSGRMKKVIVWLRSLARRWISMTTSIRTYPTRVLLLKTVAC